MMRPNPIGRENRLCYRLIEDVNSKVRYTSRVADANAARQEVQRAQSLMSTGGPQTTTSAAGQAATQNLKDIAAGVDYNAVQDGRRTGPSSADIMDQATISAQGLRTNFNQTTGNIRSDNTRVNTGQIDEAARKRLIAAGMTPEQATQRIQENRAAVQGAFNQVGTNSGGIVDLSTLKPFTGEGRAGVAETPAEFEARKAAIAAQNTSLMEQQRIEKESQQIGQQEGQQVQISGSAAAPTTGIPGMEAAQTPTPNASGMAAAFANIPPEYAFLAPALQQVQDSLAKSMAENTALTESTLKGIDETYGGIDKQLQEMRDGYKASTEAIQQLLEDAKETNDEALAKQEKAERERLAWSELQQGRQIEKQKREAHESMVAQIALGGGFGQDASLRAVAESDAEFESRMDDLKVNFSFARTDLAAKFSALYAENNNNYVTKTTENAKELQSAMERIGMQGISNAMARQQAEQSAMEGYVSRQSNLRTALAQSNLDAAWQIRGLIKEEKQAKIDAEDRALDQISDLLKNFPESEVRDMVLELGKNVTSFSVEKMLNAKSNDEIKAARAAAAARANAAAMLLAQKSANAPIITKDEFLKQKIAEKETASGMTMSQKARDEYISANQDYFDSQYDQYTTPTFQNITSGNPNVDAATDAYMTGGEPLKTVAKAFGVAEADVLMHAQNLRNEGVKIGDIRVLDKEQRTELATLRKDIKANDITKKLDAMETAVPKIGIAGGSSSGVGDVALLNFYQNGIVDPGLAVRAEDAALLMRAAALRDKVSKDYAEGVLLRGELFPDQVRKDMEEIAGKVYEATLNAYNEKVFAPAIAQAEPSGITPQYFDYLKRGGIETPGSNADTLTSSFGY
jgi:hypothetical protein